MQIARINTTRDQHDSLEDTLSEGYSSRKSSDELQHERFSKSISTRILLEAKSACTSRRNSFIPINHIGLLQQNSLDKPSISNILKTSNIWKTSSANMKTSSMPLEKNSHFPGRSNSDISSLGKSVLKTPLTKKSSHS